MSPDVHYVTFESDSASGVLAHPNTPLKLLGSLLTRLLLKQLPRKVVEWVVFARGALFNLQLGFDHFLHLFPLVETLLNLMLAMLDAMVTETIS